jgi:hypothetical protein
MSSGATELAAMIARIRSIPRLAEREAPAVARAIEAEITRTIAAGTDPSGKEWPLTLEGEVALPDAASVMRVAAVGTRIYVFLRGAEARHHLGRARGRKLRQVIPTSSVLPDAMCDRIREVLAEGFREATYG